VRNNSPNSAACGPYIMLPHPLTSPDADRHPEHRTFVASNGNIANADSAVSTAPVHGHAAAAEAVGERAEHYQ